MYCQAFFSHKELHGKSAADKHEMLHKIGRNWATDVNSRYKNGTFIQKREGQGIECRSDIPPWYEHIDMLLSLTVSL